MPLDTREAMLGAINSGPIIVGAYVDREGGMCPMLAAHRNGGRTSFSSFARAWDNYTRAGNGARPASDRELCTLRAMLEASIAIEERYGRSGELGEAIAAHQESVARNGHTNGHSAVTNGNGNGTNGHKRADTGERDRTRELRQRSGWAWLRPLRRLDEFEVAMDQLEEIERDRREEPESELV
jgi:hypothetical protein